MRNLWKLHPLRSQGFPAALCWMASRSSHEVFGHPKSRPALLMWHRLKTRSPVSNHLLFPRPELQFTVQYCRVSRPKGSRLWVHTDYYSPIFIACSGDGLARSTDSFPVEKSSVLSMKLLLTGVCELPGMQDFEWMSVCVFSELILLC